MKLLKYHTCNALIFIMLSTGISDGPENVAVNIGNVSRFTCRTEPNSKLRWSMRLVGESVERMLTRDEQILPSLAGNYSTEKSSGQLTLIVNNTRPHHAGRYICLELSSSKTASAELVVIGKCLVLIDIKFITS